MYSVVLMMALSGGAELPAGHGCKCCGCNCCGCYSCCGCNCKGCHGCKKCHGCNGCHCCGCYGCCGYHGCCGGHVVCCGGAAAPAAKPEEIKKKPEEKKSMMPAPATIVVSLPADAKLFVDDAVTTSTTATRAFASPALEQGKDYFYTLKAEVVRDGKTYSASRRVAVRAGEETAVTLEVPEVAVAQR